MASISEDVVREILLHLPLKPLLRLRTVCKLWRDIIDSIYFRQSHILQHANNNNDEYDAAVVVKYKSEDEVKNTESFEDYAKCPLINSIVCSLIEDLPEIPIPEADRFITVPGRIVSKVVRCEPEIVGPVKGLFCIYHPSNGGIAFAVYNPGLDLIRELPFDGYRTKCSCSCWCICSCYERYVSIGYDNIAHDYKVLQLLKRHALIYSKTTNSWRELAYEGYDFFSQDNFCIRRSIKSLCTDSGTTYWVAAQGVPDNMKEFILSFDMKSEVFGVFEMPDFLSKESSPNIFVKRDKFVLLDYHYEEPSKWLSIYEAKIEENSILHWDFVAEVPKIDDRQHTRLSLWRNDYLVLNFVYPKYEMVFYDYRQNKVVRKVPLPVLFKLFNILRYKGSFIMP